MSTEFAALADAVSTWGRWGADDERGALNLVDGAARKRAVAAVVESRSVALSLPLDAAVPATLGNPRRFAPVVSLLAHDEGFGDAADTWNEDQITTPLQAGTHWDALAHVAWQGQIYNGFPVDTVTAAAGASRCGIDKVGELVTRGVLLDVAAARQAPYLEAGDHIGPDDLDRAAGEAGVDVEPGDVVLVRTGAMGRWLAGPGAEKKAYVSGSPGFSVACASWFAERGVAAVAVDSQNPDAFPSGVEGMLMPFGVLALQRMGMMLGQNWVLEELAAACRAVGRGSFLLAASPLPIRGGLGSPVQPTALL